jgi:hypothetical protein
MDAEPVPAEVVSIDTQPKAKPVKKIDKYTLMFENVTRILFLMMHKPEPKGCKEIQGLLQDTQEILTELGSKNGPTSARRKGSAE